MKKNIISIRVMESKGLKVTLENRILKVKGVHGCDEECQRQKLVLFEE